VTYAATSLPLRKQGKGEAQRSIRTFYEVVKVEMFNVRTLRGMNTLDSLAIYF
jgi:hypothetical protein